MTTPVLYSALSLCVGFSLAGALTSGYQLLCRNSVGFSQMTGGVKVFSVAAVPFLVFAAPFLIMRNTLRGQIDQYRFQIVTLATVVAGFWSLLSGSLIVMLLRYVGLLA